MSDVPLPDACLTFPGELARIRAYLHAVKSTANVERSFMHTSVSPSQELLKRLREIDRRSYPAYKSLQGSWRFPSYILSIDHVQGDPFASPSHLTAHISLDTAGFPPEFLETATRRTALCDWLLRRFGRELSSASRVARGSGKSGVLTVSRCGQEVLARTACEIGNGELAIRFFAGFPAAGRTVLAGELEKILFDLLPPCIEKSLFWKNLPKKALQDAIALSDDQQFLRRELERLGLAAFVADGSILPRESGVSDLPLQEAVPFTAPESLAVTLNLPHRGPLRGMGIRRGITLIAGGGYHGKSTLLKALERGVYDHIPGDGREYVAADSTAVKLRAEDGRKISDADISLFIHDLPNGKDTRRFSTPDASGSTSQAANIVEAMETGCRLFLIDEDTSATNFMIRDELMQEVISRDKEPITPFLERARALYLEAGVSSILVVGSCGAYFYLADTILQMDEYRPVDITERVRHICGGHPAPSLSAPGFQLPDYDRGFAFLNKNTLPKNGRDAALEMGRGYRGRGGYGRGAAAGHGHAEAGYGRETAAGSREHQHAKIRMQGPTGFSLDHMALDLRYLEQLVDPEQTAAIAHLLRYVMETCAGKNLSCQGIMNLLSDRLAREGLSGLSGGSYTAAGLAMPRLQEIMACFYRV